MRVDIEGLTFGYDREQVLRGVDIALPENQVTVVIGPSGCGKSTLIRLLSGLHEPAAGRILFDGKDTTSVPSERRDIGVLFQSYALFPHMSVRENVAFGLTSGRRRLSPEQAERRVQEIARWLGLTRLLERRPAQLSGGEQQRAALARALAPEPGLLLLDEPLSSLDARLRRGVRHELAALLRRLKTTTLYVTHDQEEAMLLADRLVVLRDGRVEQAGEPLSLYRRPATAFVASFLGETNLLDARVLDARGATGAGLVATPMGEIACAVGGGAAGTLGRVMLRPEDFFSDEAGTPTEVLEARPLGPYSRLRVRLASGPELLVHWTGDRLPAPGSELRVGVLSGRGHFLTEDRR